MFSENFNKIKKLILDNYYIVIVFLFYCAIHSFMRFISCDDPVYIAQARAEEFNLFTRLYEAYFAWTSRVLMQAAMYIFSYFPFVVWRILDSIFATLLLCQLNSISSMLMKENRKASLLVAIIFLTWPFSIMGSTGWITTTTNVLWVGLTFCYFLKLCIKRFVNQNELSSVEIIVGVFSIIYASNHESCLPMVFFVLITLLVFYKRKVLKDFYYRVCCVISVGMLILMLFCPGLRVRMNMNRGTEIMYSDYSFFSKIRMGISTTFYQLWSFPNIIFALICLVLGYVFYKKNSTKRIRYISFIPTIINILGTVFVLVKYSVLERRIQYVYPDIEGNVITLSEQIIVSLLGIVIYILIYVMIYNVFGQTDGILLIGLCTMFLIPVAELCLTPDISLSFMRVIFYPYLSYIIVVYCLLIKNKDIFSSPFTKLVYYVSILGFVLNLMQIIRHMYLYG